MMTQQPASMMGNFLKMAKSGARILVHPASAFWEILFATLKNASKSSARPRNTSRLESVAPSVWVRKSSISDCELYNTSVPV